MPLLLWLAAVICAVGFAATAQAPHSPIISTDDQFLLAQALSFSKAVQDKIWSGWSRAPFAILLVTPEYEFLFNHPKPTPDFAAVDRYVFLRTNGKVFYRRRVFDTNLLATFPAVNGISTIVVGQFGNTSARSRARWVLTVLHEHFHQLQDSQPGIFAEYDSLGLAHGDQTGMWMLTYPFLMKRLP